LLLACWLACFLVGWLGWAGLGFISLLVGWLVGWLVDSVGLVGLFGLVS